MGYTKGGGSGIENTLRRHVQLSAGGHDTQPAFAVNHDTSLKDHGFKDHGDHAVAFDIADCYHHVLGLLLVAWTRRVDLECVPGFVLGRNQ